MLHSLPANTSLLRLSQIIGRKATSKVNAIPALIPVSKSTWWAGVKSGRYPQPVKLSERITAWRSADVMRVIEQAGEQDAGA